MFTHDCGTCNTLKPYPTVTLNLFQSLMNRFQNNKTESMKTGYVYIMSNKNRTTLYVGVTNDIERRVLEHKSGYGSAFTQRYKLHALLYYDDIPGMGNAIAREKQLKNWHREWKWNLIKEENPDLKDLAEDWFSTVQIQDMRDVMRQVRDAEDA